MNNFGLKLGEGRVLHNTEAWIAVLQGTFIEVQVQVIQHFEFNS